MRVSIAFLALAVLAGTLPQAQAREASFRVGATVVSGHDAGPLLRALPRPQGSQAMATTAAGAHHAFPGPLPVAGDFYRQAMPTAGFSLVSEHGAHDTGRMQQVWNDGSSQVVIDLQAAIGSMSATRISLQASAAGPRLAAR
jgi:hypothetical protein